MTVETGNVHNRMQGEGIMTEGLYKSPDGCIRISMTQEAFENTMHWIQAYVSGSATASRISHPFSIRYQSNPEIISRQGLIKKKAISGYPYQYGRHPTLQFTSRR